MLVSIIVPVYNAEKYLSGCIESILNQTYKNLEIILIDDGSKDTSAKICDEFALEDSRVKVIHKENGGVSVARNMGIDMAKGEFIAFVDADDYLSDTMIEKLCNAIVDKDISLCRFSQVKQDLIIDYQEENLKLFKDKPYNFKYIMVDKYSKNDGEKIVTDKMFGSVWRTLFRKNIINDNNIRFLKGVKIAEDRLFLLEYCSYCNTAGIVDEYLYNYRVGLETQATGVFNKYQPNLEKSQKLLVEKQIELINKNVRLSKKERKSLINFLKVRAAYTVTLNEIWYNNEEYKNNLKFIFSDRFYSNAIKFRYFNDLYRNYNTNLKTLVLYLLMKLKFWSLINEIIFKRKGKNNAKQ